MTLKPRTFPYSENDSYSQMKNNVIAQSAQIAEIINHAGKFQKFYNELNNIADSTITMISNYVDNSKNAIKIDIYDGLVNSIDFPALQSRLKNDVKNTTKLVVPRSKNVDFDMSDYTIDTIETDAFVNMMNYFDTKTVKKFVQFQNIANDNLENMIESLDQFEQDLCSFRVKKIEEMKPNVETLYSIHANYVRALQNKTQNVPEKVKVCDVEIPMMKSQKAFITNALKKIIDVQ